MYESDLPVGLEAAPISWWPILQVVGNDEGRRSPELLPRTNRRRPDRDIPDIGWLIRPDLFVRGMIVNDSKDVGHNGKPDLRSIGAVLPRAATLVPVIPLDPLPCEQTIDFGDDQRRPDRNDGAVAGTINDRIQPLLAREDTTIDDPNKRW